MTNDTTTRVLDYIRQCNPPPTLREIIAETGLKSISAAKYHLTKLAQAGQIAIVPGAARGIILLDHVATSDPVAHMQITLAAMRQENMALRARLAKANRRLQAISRAIREIDNA